MVLLLRDWEWYSYGGGGEGWVESLPAPTSPTPNLESVIIGRSTRKTSVPRNISLDIVLIRESFLFRKFFVMANGPGKD